MKLEIAKCPNCGATLDVDAEREQVYCQYCGNLIMISDAVQKYKMEVSGKIELGGNVAVDGIKTIKAREEKAEFFVSTGKFIDALTAYEELLDFQPTNCKYAKKLIECCNHEIDKLMTFNYENTDYASIAQKKFKYDNETLAKINQYKMKRKFAEQIIQKNEDSEYVATVGVAEDAIRQEEEIYEEKVRRSKSILYILVGVAFFISVIVSFIMYLIEQ